MAGGAGGSWGGGVRSDVSGRPAHRWRRVWRAVDQFVFPRACAACGEAMTDHDAGLVCGLCWARVARLPHPQCDRCGHPGRGSGPCRTCATLPPFVRAVRSYAWVPDPAASAIIGALKYEGWPGVAAAIGARLARLRFPADVIRERAAVVPVPLAAERERHRGFNQSRALADAVARVWDLPVCEALRRTRVTASQTRLTPTERLANVHGAFAPVPARVETLIGHHVLLVDDVFTTGATLNACAASLFAAGARTISYLTFGRARGLGDP